MFSAEIKDVKIDNNKNIYVETEYFNDGVSVQVGGSRYEMLGYANISELANKVKQDIKTHLNTLMIRKYVSNKNQESIPSLGTNAIGYISSITAATIVIGTTKYTLNETTILSTETV